VGKRLALDLVLTPFGVSWDVAPLRGEVVTLEIVDKSTSPWGFIGVQGFALDSEK